MTWTSMTYGAPYRRPRPSCSSPSPAGTADPRARPRRRAAVPMPIAWNTILRVTGASDAFSHDLPLRITPIS